VPKQAQQFLIENEAYRREVSEKTCAQRAQKRSRANERVLEKFASQSYFVTSPVGDRFFSHVEKRRLVDHYFRIE
jgi:hypothetical protein